MKSFLSSLLPDQHPFKLLYHKLMAVLAAVYYGFPGNSMLVIAVTGTNGKTTTATFIHAIFMKAGRKAGLFSTAEFKIGDQVTPNLYKQTTVSPWVLQRKLWEMKQSKCKVVVLEATSHAMIQNRLWGLDVDTAVFTNLTEDHILYHGSMEAYKEAKGRLFRHLNLSRRKPGTPKISVINQDDPNHDYFDAFPVDQAFPYGIQKGIYSGRNLVLKADGSDFVFKVPNGEVNMHLPIPGKMNVYNALAAATVALANRVPVEVIAEAMAHMSSVPGRVEPISEGQAFTAIVDYAHTEDALQQLLSLFKELTQGKLIVVFGATGGGRDQEKRPKMGAILHQYADEIIVTNDDPYEEDPEVIARMLRQGIPREEGDHLWQVLTRVEAIRLALSMAKAGDTVIVAGKGAEAFQVLGKQRIPHDDRQVVRDCLRRTVDVELGH